MFAPGLTRLLSTYVHKLLSVTYIMTRLADADADDDDDDDNSGQNII